jgi:hypothetical protein
MKGPARVARQPGQHFGMFVGGIVVEPVWINLPAGTWRSTALRKRMNSRWRWRCMPRPITVPSSTLRAANRVVVPPAFAGAGYGACNHASWSDSAQA